MEFGIGKSYGERLERRAALDLTPEEFANPLVAEKFAHMAVA
jgi:hypothetical protein